VDPGARHRERADPLRGAVGRSVVDKENVERAVSTHPLDLADECVDVLELVVRRNDDDKPSL